jgi:hypothetical protein
MADFTVSIDAAQAMYMDTILPRFSGEYDANTPDVVPEHV